MNILAGICATLGLIAGAFAAACYYAPGNDDLDRGCSAGAAQIAGVAAAVFFLIALLAKVF